MQVEKNCYVSANLMDLMADHWSEQKNAYKLMSKIDEADEKRVKLVINQSRYSNMTPDL